MYIYSFTSEHSLSTRASLDSFNALKEIDEEGLVEIVEKNLLKEGSNCNECSPSMWELVSS